MLTTLPNQSKIAYKSPLFNLTVKCYPKGLAIRMEMGVPVLNTSLIPQTSRILNKQLPDISRHKCYNQKKLPFLKEAENTEIGHLFEHILIEYLYQHLNRTKQSDIFLKGETSWDWHKDKPGTFHIEIRYNKLASSKLFIALKQSIVLTSQILQNHEHFYLKSKPLEQLLSIN